MMRISFTDYSKLVLLTLLFANMAGCASYCPSCLLMYPVPAGIRYETPCIQHSHETRVLLMNEQSAPRLTLRQRSKTD